MRSATTFSPSRTEYTYALFVETGRALTLCSFDRWTCVVVGIVAIVQVVPVIYEKSQWIVRHFSQGFHRNRANSFANFYTRSKGLLHAPRNLRMLHAIQDQSTKLCSALLSVFPSSIAPSYDTDLLRSLPQTSRISSPTSYSSVSLPTKPTLSGGIRKEPQLSVQSCYETGSWYASNFDLRNHVPCLRYLVGEIVLCCCSDAQPHCVSSLPLLVRYGLTEIAPKH